MSAIPFELGLCEEDERAIRLARRDAFVFEREAALRLMADASALVDAAVRRRPLLSGAAFTLPDQERRV
jgi:hypothetical protein